MTCWWRRDEEIKTKKKRRKERKIKSSKANLNKTKYTWGQLLQKFFGAAKMWFRQGLNLLSSDELACPKPTLGHLGHIHSLDKE